VFADTFNVAVDMDAGAEFEIDARPVERALYLLEGEVQLDGADIPVQHLVVLDRGASHRLRARTPVKAMLLGGEPLDAPRHMWWNFVSSSKDRIEQAKQDWLDDRFGKIEGETEFIPLPDR
jgi:redox-sensitive bicupin YhaK (pirin superfamily)